MFESRKRHHLSRAALALTPDWDKPEGASAWELRGYAVGKPPNRKGTQPFGGMPLDTLEGWRYTHIRSAKKLAARGKVDAMTAVISSINLKGGVGKTTIAVNYAAYCGSKGRKVLLIDLDPQANASFASIGVEGWEQHISSKGTVADLLGARKHKSADGSGKGFDDVIAKDVFNNVDLIPSHLDLFTIDLDMSGKTAREFQLKKSIKDHIENYDVVICDCPPNLTLPTQNALAISTGYIVPVSLDYLSVLGIGLLLGRLESLSQDLDVELSNAGIILSRVGRPAKHRAKTEKEVRDQFPDLVLKGQIKDRVSVSESAEKCHSIFSSGDALAIAEFNYIFSELDSRLDLL